MERLLKGSQINSWTELNIRKGDTAGLLGGSGKPQTFRWLNSYFTSVLGNSFQSNHCTVSH